MKPALLLTLSLFLSAVAPAAPSTPAAPPLPAPVRLNEDGSLSEEAELELKRYQEARERREHHSPLNGILAFIHDRASADAAAPRVKELLASPEGKEAQMPNETAISLQGNYNFYGSAALKAALIPVLDEDDRHDSAELWQFMEHSLPIIDEMTTHINRLADILETVQDEAGASKAAAALKASPDTMKELENRLAAKAQSIPRGGMADIYRAMAIMNERRSPAAERLLHAYGHAQTRRAGGFPELEAAFFHALFPTGVPEELKPELHPHYLNACEQQAAALREWLSLAAAICDKESADAAADWLTQKSAELGTPLNTCWQDYAKRRKHHGCLLQLSSVMENATTYLRYATPAFFGSEKLEQLLEVNPADFMPVPEVRPLPPRQGEDVND